MDISWVKFQFYSLGCYRELWSINPRAVEGPSRRVRSGPFYTLAYFYYTTIYHLLPLLASVWVPAACETVRVVVWLE